MLRSHARNGNEFQTPGQIENSSEIHETWHAIMERNQHAMVNFLSCQHSTAGVFREFW